MLTCGTLDFYFLTCVVFFLHSRNIYIIGLGQGIKLVVSKIHGYVSVHWRHIKIKAKGVCSSVMLLTVYNTIIAYGNLAEKGTPHL